MLQDEKSHAASCHQRYTCDLKATQNLSYPWVHPWVQHSQSPGAARVLSSHWEVLSALWNPCPSLFAAHFSKHLGCWGGILPACRWQMYWSVGGFWCWWLLFSWQGDKWIYLAWNCWQQLSQFISFSLLTTFRLPRWAWEPQPFSETWKAWGQRQKETGSRGAGTSCPKLPRHDFSARKASSYHCFSLQFLTERIYILKLYPIPSQLCDGSCSLFSWGA